MGQKVNPVGFRVLNRRKWDSVWFEKKNYAKKLVNDIKIREYVNKKYSHCGIASVIIERASNEQVNLIIKTSKPGALIGKKGSDIDNIKKEVEKIAGSQVEVKIIEIDIS